MNFKIISMDTRDILEGSEPSFVANLDLFEDAANTIHSFRTMDEGANTRVVLESEIEDILDNLSKVNFSVTIEDTQGFQGAVEGLVQLYVDYFSTKPNRLRDISILRKVEDVLYQVYTQRNSGDAGCMEFNPYKFMSLRNIVRIKLVRSLPNDPANRKMVQAFQSRLDGGLSISNMVHIRQHNQYVR